MEVLDLRTGKQLKKRKYSMTICCNSGTVKDAISGKYFRDTDAVKYLSEYAIQVISKNCNAKLFCNIFREGKDFPIAQFRLK